jgi:hydroxymethylpyrimidine pyrophosphatase-like HAD family hydrolase
MPRYDLIAIDLDGTLLDSRRRVSPANVRAVQAAREAGVQVVVCTGRGLVESAEALAAIEQRDPVVVAGGSIVSCPVTTSTLHRFSLKASLVERAVPRLIDHGHAVMILKDPVAAGYDYLIVHGPERHSLDPVTRWWFEKMNVRVRYVDHLHEDEHPEHSVRLGVCALSGVLDVIHNDIHQSFGEHATMHHFPAVLEPEHAARLPEGQKLHILEVFDRSASKWSAIQWLAQRRGIQPERICAIGDEINDLPMIRSAGLGVAMGNAVPAVAAAAGRRTASNDEDGVAHAIHNVLSERW